MCVYVCVCVCGVGECDRESERCERKYEGENERVCKGSVRGCDRRV